MSLLMWECGLKLVYRTLAYYVMESLLMWECGLKRVISDEEKAIKLSLLMWECGLKPSRTKLPHQPIVVTPYVGVWIETD